MSNFLEQSRFSLTDYDLNYHHPDANDTGARIEIISKTTSIVEASYDILDQNKGLKIDGEDLLIGQADHGSEVDILSMDFSQRPQYCSFSVGENPANQRLGGIGIEDLRDASRVDTHYFYLETEPINLKFDSGSGFLIAEIRDLTCWNEDEDKWYEVSSVSS